FYYQRFDLREPFIYKLVPILVEQVGGAFPELKRNPSRVAEMIRSEEMDFLVTIEKGLERFDRAQFLALASAIVQEKGHQVLRPLSASASGVTVLCKDDRGAEYETRVIPAQMDTFLARKDRERVFIPAKDLFDLHTTYGFPPDLTQQMAEERGLGVDLDGYRALMKEHEEKSRGHAVAQHVAINVSGGLPATDDRPKWSGLTGEGKILGWIDDNQFIQEGRLDRREELGLLLDRTCFY